MSTQTVPSVFKRANVCPVPKCTKPSENDYRTISLLPILSKQLERFVRQKWFANIIPHIDPLQFAFVPRLGQGTSIALSYIQHRILSFLDSPGAVRLLLPDFTKAFDKVPHSVILTTLRRFHVPQELFNWIESYLNDKKQRVVVNNNFSQWTEVTSGVPQGAVLAPFLFALVIDGLKPKHENTCLVKYADDITALHFLRNSSEIHLNSEFQHIIDWTVQHGLIINAKKTKLLHIKTRQSISRETP